MTTLSYESTDRAGDPDWQRLAVKFQQVFGYAPSTSQDSGKLLRDIRNTDPEWAEAAYRFIATFGYAPSAQTTAKLYRDIRNAGGDTGGGDAGPEPPFDSDAPVTDTPPVEINDTTMPNGGRLVRIKNPEGSDASFLWYVVYQWRGVELAYEIGDPHDFRDLFGTWDINSVGMDITTLRQGAFDDQGFVLAGSADEIVGTDESIGSRIEREVRALGLEDLPGWLAGSPDALALVAEAASQEWSSGRLWKELSTTATFQDRWGGVLDQYLGQNATIAEAVRQIERDEQALTAAIRPFLAGADAPSTEFLHGLLTEGWTPGFVAQVLEQAEVLRRDPDSLAVSNFILEQSGLETLDEVGFLNALNGYGPQETVEALNTATAARALEEAGIDLDNNDVRLIMDLVDTSDRLLTSDSWRNLAQELSLNLIRFNREIDAEKLGGVREDLVAAAFGRESPTGKSSGEVLSLLARFERDRRAASQGFDQTSGFQDAEGRLRIQGISGL